MFSKRFIVFVMGSMLALGNAVPVFAHDLSDEKSEKSEKNIDLVCMQTEIEKRDTAVMTAFDAYHTAVHAALDARRTALKTAWAQTDQELRRDAIEDAWDDFQDAFRKAKKDLKKARKAAWHTFQHDRQACGSQRDEGEGNADAQL